MRIRIGVLACLASVGVIQSCGTAEFFGFNDHQAGEAPRRSEVDEIPVGRVECPPTVEETPAQEQPVPEQRVPEQRVPEQPVPEQPVQQRPVQQTPTQLELDGASAEETPCDA